MDLTRQRVEAFRLLCKVLSHASEADEIDVNPLQRIWLLQEAPARSPVLSLKDEQKLIAVATPWFGFMIRMVILTGCHQAQLLSLRWKHVDLDGGMLTVEDSKSGESRQVVLHPVLIDELRTRRQMPEASVIVLPNGRVPSAPGVNHAMQRTVKKIGRE